MLPVAYLSTPRKRKKERKREGEKEREKQSPSHRLLCCFGGPSDGVFCKWSDCRRSVADFEGAHFRGFDALAAEEDVYGLFEH